MARRAGCDPRRPLSLTPGGPARHRRRPPGLPPCPGRQRSGGSGRAGSAPRPRGPPGRRAAAGGRPAGGAPVPAQRSPCGDPAGGSGGGVARAVARRCASRVPFLAGQAKQDSPRAPLRFPGGGGGGACPPGRLLSRRRVDACTSRAAWRCPAPSRDLLLEVVEHAVLDPLLVVRLVGHRLGVVHKGAHVHQAVDVAEEVGDFVGDVWQVGVQLLQLLLKHLAHPVHSTGERLVVHVCPGALVQRGLHQDDGVPGVVGHGGRQRPLPITNYSLAPALLHDTRALAPPSAAHARHAAALPSRLRLPLPGHPRFAEPCGPVTRSRASSRLLLSRVLDCR
mmetsp:Transcript_6847/g.17505  ORF Transcript_6847/g.17505 Transcript_6847/m.17505 type:complete len:337 (+) Transcript_6847:240-1250(+)